MKVRTTTPFIALAILLTGAVLTPGVASAQSRPWTTVGSAGMVDEADLGIFTTSAGVIWVTGAATQHLDVRYNVVPVDGLFVPMDGYALTVRFRDNGPDARVRLILREYHMTGGVVNRMVFNSNAYPAAPGYQTRTVVVCAPAWSFNFVQNAYFVEATLSKTGPNGNPALGIIHIRPTLC